MKTAGTNLHKNEAKIGECGEKRGFYSCWERPTSTTQYNYIQYFKFPRVVNKLQAFQNLEIWSLESFWLVVLPGRSILQWFL